MSRLYQINARILIKSMSPSIQSVAQVPLQYWEKLRSFGIDFVWLMGVWHTSPESIEKYCFHPDLLAEYNHANSEWEKADVAGSPYAIDSYRISPLIGHSQTDLLATKKNINDCGMKLILDFVPNHFNSESKLIDDHPEYFFQIAGEDTNIDRSVHFRSMNGYFAHGRDPYFAPWTDTVQLNYFNIETHQYMLDVLTGISKVCDGVRCDMAMLILPEIFEKTWSIISKDMVPSNFWANSIPAIKAKHPDFVFIAEAYWDTEWRLQQDGFDFTYDKKMLDLLIDGDISNIRSHLGAEVSYRKKMMHFIENHDEPRSMTSMGRQKARAASVIISTIPGMTLFFDGQWQGARKKLPVQLAVQATEMQCACSVSPKQDSDGLCSCQLSHYRALLSAINRPIFKYGQWDMINQSQMGDLLAWTWTHKIEKVIVLVNYTENLLTTTVDLDCSPSQITDPEDFLCGDSKPDYFKYQKDNHWQISLPAFQSSIVRFSLIDQSLFPVPEVD